MADSKTSRLVVTTPGLHLTPQDAAEVAKQVTHTGDEVRKRVRGAVPPEAWPVVSAKGLSAETAGFCLRMAAVQDEHGESLGKPVTTTDMIRTRVAIAEALEPAIQASEAQLETLKTLWAINLGTAYRGARDIYDRAGVVANSNAAVESAIEPVRTLRGRAAKKAAMTRRRKKEDAAKKEKDPTTP